MNQINEFNFLVVIFLLLSNCLDAQKTDKTSYELFLFGQGTGSKSFVGIVDTGEQMFDNIYRYGYDIGLGVSRSFSEKHRFSISFSYSQNVAIKMLKQDYQEKMVNYFTSIDGQASRYFLNSHNGFINYFNMELTYTHFFNDNNKNHYPFISAGLNIIHCLPFSNLKVNKSTDSATVSIFYTTRFYYNSKYENGSYDRQRKIDLAFSFNAGYRFNLNQRNFLDLSVSTLYHPRYVAITYYKTTPQNPFVSYGKFMETVSNFGIKLSYAYKIQ